MENTEDFKQERLSTCKSCPQSKYTWGIGLTCGVFLLKNYIPETCGCKLSWKANLKNQSCPQKKW